MFLAARDVMETEETGAIESDTLKESAVDIDSSLGLEGRRLQIPGGSDNHDSLALRISPKTSSLR